MFVEAKWGSLFQRKEVEGKVGVESYLNPGKEALDRRWRGSHSSSTRIQTTGRG